MRPRLLLSAVMACAFAVPAMAQDRTLDDPRGEYRFVGKDSGVRGNRRAEATIVHQEVLEVANAAWIRVYFGDVILGDESFIRITSALDGEVQELDSVAMQEWGFASAFFNGDTIMLELVAGPGTPVNRMVVDRLLVEDGSLMQVGSPAQCGICGGSDDRVPSSEQWTGRLVPAGCTASIYNEDSCMVTAGHCIGGSMVVMFNTPASNPNCSPNNPPVADQFPITSSDSVNGGPGNDWAVMTSGTNNLGQTAFERQGEFRRIAPAPPQTGGVPAALTGYGLDETCVRSSTQQTSTGSILSATALQYTMAVDLRGGNSGSAFMSFDDEIIGIVTHCSFGCPNVATRIEHPSFVEARDFMCRPANDDCAEARVVGDGTYPVVTVNATTDGASLPGSCDEGAGVGFVQDVWFQYVPSQSGSTTISLCTADFDSRIAVYDACGGALIACDDDGCGGQASELTFAVGGGETLLVRIGGVPGGNEDGAGDLTISTSITVGACCIDNLCSQLSMSTCAASGGSYQGDLSECTAQLCLPPTGACCVDTDCFELSEQNCLASAGTYLGDGAACGPQTCAPATGGCCLNESCIELTEADCSLFGGAYNGDGSTCSKDSCAASCSADITGPSPGQGDGNVDALDLLLMISQWGSPCSPCDADITGATPGVPDGNVDALDFLQLISQWGNPAVCP